MSAELYVILGALAALMLVCGVRGGCTLSGFIWKPLALPSISYVASSCIEEEECEGKPFGKVMADMAEQSQVQLRLEDTRRVSG